MQEQLLKVGKLFSLWTKILCLSNNSSHASIQSYIGISAEDAAQLDLAVDVDDELVDVKQGKSEDGEYHNGKPIEQLGVPADKDEKSAGVDDESMDVEQEKIGYHKEEPIEQFGVTLGYSSADTGTLVEGG